MAKDRLVTDSSKALANIDRYERELAASAGLQDLMSYARAWYGYRAADGRWRLAPSKFVGYAENDAKTYLRSRERRDGRTSERILSEWFQEIEPGSAVYEDAVAEVRHLFADYGRTPNKLIRIGVLRSSLGPAASRVEGREAPPSRGDRRSRITMNPDVCGGRPTVRGMRVRVSDIIDLLANGVGRAEILADYPYLEDEDISAALEYAAQAIDHRVVRVA
ncbi:MAG: DUF433 domain-containing protein [Bauldia sp.]